MIGGRKKHSPSLSSGNRAIPLAVSNHNITIVKMIFPFEITRRFKLPDLEFGDYSTSEIINNVYNYLSDEEFSSIKMECNEIEIRGNRSKWSNHIKWSKTDRMTHCIDKGTIKIVNSKNGRILIYTFQVKKYLLWSIPELFLLPLVIGLILWSVQVGLSFFYFVLAFELIYWIYLLIVHPWTIEAPLEIMRTNSTRKRINNKNYGC